MKKIFASILFILVFSVFTYAGNCVKKLNVTGKAQVIGVDTLKFMPDEGGLATLYKHENGVLYYVKSTTVGKSGVFDFNVLVPPCEKYLIMLTSGWGLYDPQYFTLTKNTEITFTKWIAVNCVRYPCY